MKNLLLFLWVVLPVSSFSQQETYSRTILPGGKLKYEYHVHKKRAHLVDEFFNLYAESNREWAMHEGSVTAVARKTRDGFEIVGDGDGKIFKCEMAGLTIDLWYEYAHVNSN